MNMRRGALGVRFTPVSVVQGWSPTSMEAIVAAAADVPSAILRLLSVYGGPLDHPDQWFRL